jgi:16S rRNA (guanine527-N7)-methyltransferase
MQQEAQGLIRDAALLGVALAAAQAEALLRLLDELSLWNGRYNLTGITEREAMIRLHLLDSLSASSELEGEAIADVGTGAGFPGLPLALVHPARRFTLIDATAKKLRFVEHAAQLLGLENVTPLQARVESLQPVTPFDTVLARAFAALPALLQGVKGLAGPATRVVAFKGRYPQVELAQLPAGWRVLQVRAVRIPGLEVERHLIRLQRQL